MKLSFLSRPAARLAFATLCAEYTLGQVHHLLVGNFGTNYNVTLMLNGTQHVGK